MQKDIYVDVELDLNAFRSISLLFYRIAGICLFLIVLGQAATAQISGVVYRDFNADGVRSYTTTTPLAGEIGVGGITVNLYSSTGLVATTTTSSATGTAAGTYSFAAGVTSGTVYRLEFVNLPTGSFNGTRGTGSGTSVQFITAPSTTANLGINDPADYCQAVPNFFVPCYVNGNPTGGGTAGTQGVLVTMPYNATSSGGNTNQESAVAINSQLGTVYGVAYQRQTKFIYSAAMVKRHAGFGGDGAGARAGTIYITKPSGTTYTHSQFVTLPTAISAVSAASLGGTTVVGSNTGRGLTASVTAQNQDATTFDQVGKAGLGDLEVSDDGTELYVVNLGDRQLYRIPINNPTSANPTAGTPVGYALPSVSQTTGSVFRPFGLKYYRGRVYVGGVTTNEAVATTLNYGGMTARDTTGMKAIVFEFNPADNSFTPVLTFPLTYQKGAAGNDQTGVARADRWYPWTHVQAATGLVPNRYARNDLPNASYPQPMLTGIEFDPVDGAMIISIRDRFGDQYGNNNYGTTSTATPYYRAIAPGDILRAGKCTPSVNQWTLESNARICNGIPTVGANTSQGPGGGEYYYSDAVAVGDNNGPNGTFRSYHAEMSEGGLALLPGRDEVASIVLDPNTAIDAGGVRRFKNSDGSGSPATSFQIYASGDVATYGKANGLGDLEIGCDLSPVQIGNRVWRDNNNNGIQDPDEPALAGVTVTLRSGSTVIATATTDANGEYYFSTATGTTTSSSVYNLTLTTGGSYTLSFPTSVSAFSISTFPNSATGTNATAIDSDADAAGLIRFTLGQSGENNFTYDVGYACTPLVLTLTSATICAGQTASLTATSGFSSYTFSSGLTQVGTTNVASGTAAGTYSVTAVNSAGCSGTAVGSITVNPLPVVSLSSATICSGQSATLTATPGFANYTFGTGLTRIGTTNQAVGSASGTYSVTAVSEAGCIGVASGTGLGGITVNALPTVTLTSATICAGQTASLTATSGLASYTLVSSTGAVLTNATGVFAVTPTSTTSYTVTGQNSSGCSSTATGSVEVRPVPVASAVSTTITCANAATVTGSSSLTGSTYAWTGPGGFTSSQQSFTTNTAGTYSLIVSSNGCSSTAVTTTVLSNTAVPTVSVNSLTLTCAQTSGTLSATATNTGTSAAYRWSTGETGSSISIISAGTYSVTVTGSNGCVATTSTTVQSNTVAPSASINSLTLTCAQPSGTLTASVSNPLSPTYRWNTGATTASINVSTSGPYSVTVTNSNGCFTTATTTVLSNTAVPTVSVNSLTLTCAQPSGTLSATATNTGTSAAYRWSTGETTASIVVASSGTYSVTVTGSNGCAASTSTTVQSNTMTPSVTINSLTLTCAQPSGTLTASVTNPMNPTYVWSTGETTASINVSASGPYSVTVTNSNGCVATVATTVLSNTAVPTVSVNSLTLTCAQTSGTLSATATNASTYLWSTGETGSSISIISAGTYSVTVTGSNGCVATTSTTVQSNTVAPSASINSLTLTCAQPSGTLTASVSNPLSPTYRWNTGATTASINVSTSGPYSVTVTNSNGCFTTATTTVLSNTAVPTVSVNSLTLTCAQPSGTLSATATNTGTSAAYRWSTGETTASIVVASSGTYSVTVTGSNGCAASTSTTVQSNTMTPSVTINSLTLTCAQPSGTLTASVTNPMNPTYLWSTGETTASINVSASGPYSVTVTNSNGCVATVATTVLSNTVVPTVSVNSLTLTCAQTSGTLSATATNASTYLWSTGETTPSITVASSGTYSVTVTASNGCVASTSTTVVSDGNVPTVSVNSLLLTCAQPSGTLAATVSNAVNPTYRWSTGETTASINVSASGPYSVTVTGSNGCVAIVTTVVQSDTAVPSISINSLTLTCAQTSGTLSATATNASAYLWSTGETTPSIVVAAAGSYSVTVTSENGCSASVATTVQSNTVAPSVSINSLTLTCAQPNGTLTASVSNAVDPTYLWSTGETTASISVSAAGPYSVTVTESNGCIATVTTVVQSDTVVPTVSVNSLTLTCAQPTGTLTASATNAISYRWSTSETAPSINVVSAGVYSVTVTGSNGCVASTTTTVESNTLVPSVSINSLTLTCAQPSGTLSATVSNAVSPTYRWNTGETTASISVSAAGPYSVTVVGSNGCVASAVTLVLSDTAVPTVSVNSLTLTCTQLTGTLSATAANTDTPAYLWSTGENTPSISAVSEGPYSVTVTSENGCFTTATTSVVSDTVVPALSVNSLTLTCAQPSGTLTASVSNAVDPTYLWSTGETTASINVANAGPYSVTVTGSNGCVATMTTVVQSDTVVPTVSVNSLTLTCAQPSGMLTATVGNAMNPTYLWSTGETTPSISVASAGSYTVTITSSNGCAASATTAVASDGNVPTVAVNSLTLTCAQPSGMLSATVSNAVSPTYRWNTGETTASISVSAAGPYSVTVVGSNGCVASAVTLVLSDTVVPTVAVNSLTLTCAQLIGTLTATASDATNPDYLWSTGETSASINVANAGPYSVTVTGDNGCVASTTTTVVSNTATPIASVNSLTLTTSQPSGTLTATVTNPVIPTYLWSTGETTPSISVSAAGPYSVTVSESNGCYATVTTVVQLDTAVPTVTVNSLTLTCAQPSGTLAATVGNAVNPTYLWSTGETSASIVVTSAGPYSVTVTGANGAFASTTTIVGDDGNLPIATINSLTLNCAQPTGTLSVSVTNTVDPTYVWSTGETTASISATVAGTYSVTVTGANGCRDVATTTVQSDTAVPNITVNSLTLTCAQPSGELMALESNAVNPTYLWSTGETSQTITVASAGPYSVTVTEVNGCAAIANTTVVSDGSVPAVQVNNLVLSCAQPSGTLSATATNVTNPAYLWNTGDVTASISVSVAGPYSVTVTGANGCFATITTNVQSDTEAPTVTISGSTTICEGEVTSLTAAGGDSYLWSTGEATNPIFVATSGIYSVTATTANGCTSTTAITVIVNPVPTLTLSSAQICEGQSTTLTASTGFDTYIFSTGLTQIGNTNLATTTASGTYSVTGITSAGCSATATGTVIANPAVTASIALLSATICEGTSALLTASGGASYIWSTGETTPTIEVVDSGVYSVTATSVDGCYDVADTTITVTDLPDLTINSATLCSGESATLTVGGCTGGAIVWSTGETTASIVVAPTETTIYSVSCAFSIGSCASTTATEVTVSNVPTVVGTVQAVTATCTGTVANNDAHIELTGLTNTERADIVMGSSYGSGPAYGAPTNLIVSGSTLTASFTNLPNPVSSQPYTIRLFSANGTCFTDVTVVLEPAYCDCPPPKCVPFVIQQTKGRRR